MRDINRIDGFLDEIKKLWEKYPDFRFGQFMLNFERWHYKEYRTDIFYLEDSAFMERIKEFYEEEINNL